MAEAFVPEIINNFNAYNKGNALIGVTGTVTLPSFEAITETISGAGILGEYESGIIGHYGSIAQEVPFRLLSDDIFSLMNPCDPVDLTFRASSQSTVKSTGGIEYKGMRIVERGRFKSFSAGKLENGKTMDGTLTLEVLYLLIEYDGKKMVELDKLNSVFVVNGVDLLEKVREYS